MVENLDDSNLKQMIPRLLSIYRTMFSFDVTFHSMVMLMIVTSLLNNPRILHYFREMFHVFVVTSLCYFIQIVIRSHRFNSVYKGSPGCCEIIEIVYL